jgi:hypothetical protein
LKYWRRITLEGVFYRWMVVDVQQEKGSDVFQRSIEIYAEDHPESKCIFVSEETGYLRLTPASRPLEVRTRLVSGCIRYALANGWNPELGGEAVGFELTPELRSQLDRPDG